MPSDRRRARLHEFIKRTLGEILEEELSAAGALVSITGVKTSPDLQWADISISIFPYNKHEKVMEILERKVGFLQHLFNKKLCIRHTPKIRFDVDHRMEAGIVEGM